MERDMIFSRHERKRGELRFNDIMGWDGMGWERELGMGIGMGIGMGFFAAKTR